MLKKNLGQYLKKYRTQKIVTKLSKIWVWDSGSGKNLFRTPDPGAKKAPDPGSGSATVGFKISDFFILLTTFCNGEEIQILQ
jgi:hypothetical protein